MKQYKRDRDEVTYKSYKVEGRQGWTARYVKEVNQMEETLRFYQEIYDDNGSLVEIHEKYPDDKGHKKIIEDKT